MTKSLTKLQKKSQKKQSGGARPVVAGPRMKPEKLNELNAKARAEKELQKVKEIEDLRKREISKAIIKKKLDFDLKHANPATVYMLNKKGREEYQENKRRQAAQREEARRIRLMRPEEDLTIVKNSGCRIC
jgi:hypothetical protein